ncbi:MAG: alpha-galactosidase [Abditibacteriota bacterium]|nr:alpha-galactosidase [Abditibacteriota bacterium]
MSKLLKLAAVLATACVLASASFAYKPDRASLAMRDAWMAEYASDSAVKLPFYFNYNGKSSLTLLTWQKALSKGESKDFTKTTKVYTDPATGLEARFVVTKYSDFPAAEYQLFLKNTSDTNTPIIENLLSLDASFACSGGPGLWRQLGDSASVISYKPEYEKLIEGKTFSYMPPMGRGTEGESPYYNLRLTDDSGVIIVGGWPGHWQSTWRYDGEKVTATFGMEKTRFYLKPGEEIYAPRMVLLFKKGGDFYDHQNVWRRWMMAHNMPRVDGKLPEPLFLSSSSRATTEMIYANEENQLHFIDRYQEEGVKLDVWWMDAAWYANEISNPGVWPIGSDYEPDPAKFPKGFAPISDYAKEKYGMKTLLWFEPENLWADTNLWHKHQDWLFLGENTPVNLLNLGLDEAREWRTGTIIKQLKNGKISIFRQDFNLDPLSYWRSGDTPDRVGMSEIKHTMGYLRMWDDIKAALPDVLIDSCASGGRRNDLEAMKRAVVLWRSDNAYQDTVQQNMSYGNYLWVPYNGTGTVCCSNASYYGDGTTPVEPYAFWSDAGISIVINLDARRDDIDYPAIVKLVDEWRSINHLYYGDFYPLTDYSTTEDSIVAYTFYSPEKKDGVLFAFRRPQCQQTTTILKLRGLDPKAVYTFTNLDTGETDEQTGDGMMMFGRNINFKAAPEAVVLRYKAK